MRIKVKTSDTNKKSGNVWIESATTTPLKPQRIRLSASILEEWERKKAGFQLETLKETFNEDIPSYSPELITKALEEHYSKDFDWALYRWVLLQTEGGDLDD